MNHRTRHVKKNVISAAGQPHQCIMLCSRHHETFRALDLTVEAFDTRRNVIWNNLVPELRPESDDEVHSPRSGSRLANGRNCGGELPAFFRIRNIKLQIGVRGRSKSEDSSLRRLHAVIILGLLTRVCRRGGVGCPVGWRPGVRVGVEIEGSSGSRPGVRSGRWRGCRRR